jgi:ABC-2 type transport system ATP-binding protein
MTTSALSIRGLTKRYGDRTVVDSLDLELPPGVIAGFIGPNGAGKTTTMAMLLGLVGRTGGEGTVLGESIDRPDKYLERVGALIETPAFYPNISGVGNLRLFAKVGGHDNVDFDALIERVGLSGRGEDRYRKYSLGMKQRLGLAAALIGNPDLLILDEPSNGLDPQGVHEMRELIGGLANTGRSVLVSSHDLSELEQICDWLIFIEKGHTIFQGPTRDLLDDANERIVVTPRSQNDRNRVERILTENGVEFERTRQTSLEERYLSMVNGESE